MANLVAQYPMRERCASIRNIDFPLPRLPYDQPHSVQAEKERYERGETSAMLDAAVAAAVASIEEDGAEVLIIGCSAAFWLCEPLAARLRALGWEVPVLEGYRCAIEMAKLMVNLRLTASALAFPSDNPRRKRPRKFA